MSPNQKKSLQMGGWGDQNQRWREGRSEKQNVQGSWINVSVGIYQACYAWNVNRIKKKRKEEGEKTLFLF